MLFSAATMDKIFCVHVENSFSACTTTENPETNIVRES